ncbi:DUF2085 domain-containing protein [Chloroflexota bacterium]
MAKDEAARRRAIRMQRFVLWLTKVWPLFVAGFFALYTLLPFVAPTLMHLGIIGPARVIYTVYSPMCHQFAFRSWFLFGEQPAYPRAAAGVEALEPFESYAPQDMLFSEVGDLQPWTQDLQLLSRSFVGNEQMGYKVALCERDIAIYGALTLFALFFSIGYVRRRLGPAPILLFILLGLGPIGLDGFSQLLSNPPFNFWPSRESTPLLRTVTGALFGLMCGWLAFPYLEEGMQESRQEILRKLRSIGELD